jgi:hypothetical protein
VALHPGDGRRVQLEDDDRRVLAEKTLDDRAPDAATASRHDEGGQRAGW